MLLSSSLLSLRSAGTALLKVMRVLPAFIPTKNETRVTEAQRNGSNHNHNTLEDDERNFLADQAAIVPILQLGDTVCASGKYEKDRRGQAEEKGVEAPTKASSAARPHISNHVVGKADDKGGQDNDLQSQTGHGDIDAEPIVAVRVARHGAASGLKNKTDGIKGNEDPVEQLRIETG